MTHIARSTALLLALQAFAPGTVSADERADTTLTLGTRPAIVAFFGLPMSAADADPDVGMVVGDLHFFLKDARPALEQLGLDVHEVYETAIRLRTPDREWDLAMQGGLPVGYYLWAPKGPAYVCRGVRRDVDLLAIVGVYLDEVQKGAPSKLPQCDRVDP